MLVIQQWMTREKFPALDDHWEAIKDFELDEYDKATAFAMDLSMEKKTPTELAVFEDGKCTAQSFASSQSQE